MVVYAVISETKVEGEEEAARGRERSDVDVPGERLVAEVADLRIEPAIIALHEQVTAAEREAGRAKLTAERALHERLGDPVAERHLAQLHERPVLDVGTR